MGYTVSSIIPRIAARLNDSAQDIFTNDTILSFAQDAADELQMELELYGILALEKKSPVIVIPQGVTDMGTAGLLPNDMLEPQKLQERISGSTDLFVDMTRRMWTPEVQPTDSLRYWDYREENIFFVGATQARDVKISYLKRLIVVMDVNSVINVNNSQQFMINRTAAMCARDIGENPTRADELDNAAARNLEKVIRIGVKSKQGTRTRRRPFVLTGRRNWA